MERIFPLQEHVEIEEIYGSKRLNSQPPKHPKTHIFGREGPEPENNAYTARAPEWFTLERISAIEKVSLEDVLDALGEERYREARNKIVQAYDGGERPMSMSRAIGIAGVDLAVLLRLFAFLETWGIINFRSLLEDGCKEHGKGNLKGCKEAEEDKLDLKHIFQISKCECSGEGRWLSSSGVVVCTECYKYGKLPPKHSQSDFHEITDVILGNMWSKHEELLLLEGILRFGDQWGLVSGHVGTKNRDQCIFHFLNMPILENTLSKVDFDVGIPFRAAENPVMCLVAFLCAIVHPSVGAESARLAMMNVGSSKEAVVDAILEGARSKAAEQIKLEEEKLRRLEDVMNEAALVKLRLKIGKYRELHDSVDKIREELAELRQVLIEERSAMHSDE
jgi:SWI/SNF related-matrix-associated actin-dependent regulator of chromatin subfamily C